MGSASAFAIKSRRCATQCLTWRCQLSRLLQARRLRPLRQFIWQCAVLHLAWTNRLDQLHLLTVFIAVGTQKCSFILLTSSPTTPSSLCLDIANERDVVSQTLLHETCICTTLQLISDNKALDVCVYCLFYKICLRKVQQKLYVDVPPKPRPSHLIPQHFVRGSDKQHVLSSMSSCEAIDETAPVTYYAAAWSCLSILRRAMLSHRLQR